MSHVMCFRAVTSAGSAELIAVSSLFTYDGYWHYINPRAGGKQLLIVSKIMVLVYTVLVSLVRLGDCFRPQGCKTLAACFALQCAAQEDSLTAAAAADALTVANCAALSCLHIHEPLEKQLQPAAHCSMLPSATAAARPLYLL